MKYEKPEVTVVASAVEIIQSAKFGCPDDGLFDASPAYEDWE
jgi:hypothetical protein